MAIGPNLTRGDRRRRVLTEKVLGSAVSTQPSTSGRQAKAHEATGASRYTEAAAYENQSRVSDLVPRWRITIALLWLFGVALVAGLVELHLRQAAVAALLGQPNLQTLDLASLRSGTAGGLGVWFASSTLGLASMMCLLIYSIRRYRIDDYHGRYRIWLWIAAICLLLSINTTANLHMPLVRVGVGQTGWTALIGDAVWWVTPLTVVAAIFGIRLVAELRQCRTSLLALLVAGACWTTAIVTHLDLLAVGDPLMTTAVVAGGTLAGHVLLLTALAVYARHVVLDADGLLAVRHDRHEVREADAKATRAARVAPAATQAEAPTRLQAAKACTPPAVKQADTPSGRRRTDLDPAPIAKPKSATCDTRLQSAMEGDADLESDDGDDELQGGARKLSKTERKRLRKQRQRDRQRHAA